MKSIVKYVIARILKHGNGWVNMTQIRLVLADLDQMFLEKFSAYLHKNKSVSFQLELFTSPSKLENWLEKGDKADLVAISSSFLSKMDTQLDLKNLVVLKDSPQSQFPQNYATLHKYRPAETLMKEILSLCADNLTESLDKKESSGQMHLVLYADGSDVLNPMAQALTCFYAKNHQPPFYLNLDEFSNTDMYFTGNHTRGLSEMLYYVKSQKDNLSLKAEACSTRDFEYGVEFMKGHQNSEDIVKLSPVDCESLIKAIRGRACYSEIILSRAFHNDELLPLLVQEAHKIYITLLDYPTSHDRLKKIITLLNRLEERMSLVLKEKVLICVTRLNKESSANTQDIPHYRMVYLPLPNEEGADFFPPSKEYQSALESILAQASTRV